MARSRRQPLCNRWPVVWQDVGCVPFTCHFRYPVCRVHNGAAEGSQLYHTDRMRYVFKLRLRPGQVQRALFNTDGYDGDEVTSIIRQGYQKWQGNEARLEHMQRAKLWR